MKTELRSDEVTLTRLELHHLSTSIKEVIKYLDNVSFVGDRAEEIPTLVGKSLGTLKYANISLDVLIKHVFEVE